MSEPADRGPVSAMKLATHFPQVGGFHLDRLEVLARGERQSTQSIDAYGLHICSWLDVVFGSVAQAPVLVKRRAVIRLCGNVNICIDKRLYCDYDYKIPARKPHIDRVEALRLENENFANGIGTGMRPCAHGGVGLGVCRW